MSKTSFAVFAGILLLSGCGSDQANQGVYAYNAGPGRGVGPAPGGVIANQCNPRVVQDWNQWIATRCNDVKGDRQADACVNGAELFRRKYPGITCNISVADSQWGLGQGQSWFEINDSVIYGIFYKFGRNAPGRNDERGGRDRPVPVGPAAPGPGSDGAPGYPGR